MKHIEKEELEKITNKKIPRGQILTSKWKKYVYLPDGGYVYKGPWNKNEEKIGVVKFRTEICKIMNADVLIPEFLIDDSENIWLKFKNLATIPYSEWITDEAQGKLESEIIKVIKRESLGYLQLTKLSNEEQYEVFFGKTLFFKNYILMALLGVGDMGPWNTLVSNGETYIIDYEDNSARKKLEMPKDFFAKTNNKALISLLEKGVQERFADIENYVAELEGKLVEFQKLANKMSVRIDFKVNFAMIKNFIKLNKK